MRKTTGPVGAGAAAGALLFCNALLTRHEQAVMGAGQQAIPARWKNLYRFGAGKAAERKEGVPSWNMAETVIDIIWTEGKMTSSARNVLASLFVEHDDLTLERLREMILSGEFREATSVADTTFQEIRDIFV